MNNQLAFKNLCKIRNISIALFFIGLFTTIFSIALPVALATWMVANNPMDPSAPYPPTNGLDPTTISTIVFPLIIGLTFMLSTALSIANIIFACQTKINNETITIIVVFAALGFVLFVVAPLVLWILSSKYKKIAEDEMIKENKATKAEAAQVQI